MSRTERPVPNQAPDGYDGPPHAEPPPPRTARRKAAKPAATAGRGGDTKGWVPSSIEAERSVVAALLVSPALYDDVVDVVTDSDFSDAGCAAVFRAIAACESSGKPVDQITVAEELRRSRELTKVGGLGGLGNLVEFGAGVTNTVAHAEIVAEKAQLRRIIDAGREMATEAMAPEADADMVRERAEELVFELGKPRQGTSLIRLADAVPRMLAELEASRNQILLGQPSGFKDLDALTGGFQPGQLIVLAARPSMGKSAIAVQMARHIAETTGLAVPFLSYEMSTSELTIRMLSSALRYSAMSLRRGFLPAGMDRRLAKEAEAMAQLPLYIDDNPPATIGGVRSAMRRLARRAELGAVFVDYMQLLESDRRGRSSNRTEEVSDISRGFKRLASELGVPFVVLSQLSRQLEQRPNKRPQLSDLRESGSIEQDANTVMFVYRDSVYNANADDTLAELIVAKQRSGPVGTVYLDWDAESATFSTTNRKPDSSSAGGRGGHEPF